MHLTFRAGSQAVDALRFDSVLINDVTVRVRLQTPDWVELVQKELSLVKSNTVALFNTTSNSLLGEDFNVPSMSFDADGAHLPTPF